MVSISYRAGRYNFGVHGIQNGSRDFVLTSYLSVLRHYFKIYNLNASCLDHRKIFLLIKAISINSVYKPRVKANITIDILHKLFKGYNKFNDGIVYKAVFLLANFGLLRLSTVAPPSSSSFGVSRHLLWGMQLLASRELTLL